MTQATADRFHVVSPNPLDHVEQMAANNDWPYERMGDEEISLAVPSSWTEYHLRFYWREDGQVLQVASVFDFRIPKAKRTSIYEALSLINERLWVGHFEIWSEEDVVMYRHAALTDQRNGGFSPSFCELLTDTAVSECERYYPVFQFVIWAGKSPAESLEAAMLETMGEA
ncbi:MAG: YbjN domain-containing protein [Sphingomonadales bacterium]|nr:YbjN domain-containing protein [Sphingomonadales bacterium]